MDDDALREKLFNLLQRTGIKNNVKAKLRAELIGLFSKQIKNKQFSDLPQSQKNLVNKVTDQMIAKHLEGQGYEYSRSVFATEAGIEKEVPINVTDFFDIPDATHRKLLSSDNLSDVIKHLISSTSNSLSKSKTADEQSQTSQELLNYNEKLALIDHRKKLRIQALDHAGLQELEKTIQTRLEQAFQRNLERKIHETELRVKQEQQNIYERKIQDIHDQASMKISVQEQHLLEKERNQKDRISSEHQLNQKELFQERQRLVQQAEDNSERLRTIDLLKAEQEQVQIELQKREAELQNADVRFEEKVRLNKLEAKNEAEIALKKEKSELEDKREEITSMKRNLEERESELKIREGRLLELEKQHTDTKQDLSKMKDRFSALEIRNQTLQYKLDQMHDYESVKEVNNLMKAQIDTFPGKGAKDFLDIQKRWCDQVSEMRSLMNRIEQASLEQEAIQNAKPKQPEVSHEELPDTSFTLSVSSFVQEMKQRVDNLETETKLVNDQYDIYKTT